MSGISDEDIVEMLNNIFTKCDVDGNGVVDIDTLVNFLTCQEPTWENDQTIEEEFRQVLCCNESTQRISKDYFISSLLTCIKLKNQPIEQSNHDETQELAGRRSSNDNKSPEIILVSMRNNSINSGVCFVADGQTLTSEDVADEISVSDCESPPINRQLVKSLQDERNALQRKNEYLESANSSLIGQISSLEEIIAKNKKESATDLKKLLASHQLLEMQKQKQEEVEEKLCLFVDDNKSVTMQLSQSERENSKLKELISQLEKQVDLISNEKFFQDTKLKDIKEKYNVLNDLFTKSQEEFENLKIENKKGKESFEQLVEENANLKLQLDSSDIFIQELESQLAATFKELSNLQNKKRTVILQPSNLLDNQGADNSVIYDENFTLDSTIPFEKLLLAELQDKETQRPCKCDHGEDLYFTSSSPVSSEKSYNKADSAVGTDEKRISHQATMTVAQEVEPILCLKSYRDVGVNCTLKSFFAENMFERNNCKFCLMKSKRSLSKWLVLCFILLLLCFLLGFFSSLFAISNTSKRSPKPVLCLSSLLDLFKISKNHLPLY